MYYDVLKMFEYNRIPYNNKYNQVLKCNVQNVIIYDLEPLN